MDNFPSFSFRFENDNGEPVRVTFVVQGNITFGDNLFYTDPQNDAVAFVAIEDPQVPDSGNILFGDDAPSVRAASPSDLPALKALAERMRRALDA